MSSFARGNGAVWAATTSRCLTSLPLFLLLVFAIEIVYCGVAHGSVKHVGTATDNNVVAITTASQIPNGIVGGSYSYTLSATGGSGVYTWTATGLPQGLAIDASSGAITGTPSNYGSNSFTATVTDTNNAVASAAIQLTISPQCPLLMEFSGALDSDATNSLMKGANLQFYWAQISPENPDTQPPGYLESQLESVVLPRITPWVNAGKSVSIRLELSGWKKWVVNGISTTSATPSWVYDLETEPVKNVIEADGAIKPVYWNAGFESSLTTFVNGFAAFLANNPAVASNIAFIQIGIGDGGETDADTYKTGASSANNARKYTLWTQTYNTGYSNLVWFNYNDFVTNAYLTAFQNASLNIPMDILPDSTYYDQTASQKNVCTIWGATHAQDQINQKCQESVALQNAIHYGLWLQDDGFQPGRSYNQTSNPFWAPAQSVIIEQVNEVTSTSTYTLDQYLSAAQSQQDPKIYWFIVNHSDLWDSSGNIIPANQQTIQNYLQACQIPY